MNDESIRQENMRLRAELSALEVSRVEAQDRATESIQAQAALQAHLNMVLSSTTWGLAHFMIKLTQRIPPGLRNVGYRGLRALRAKWRGPDAAPPAEATPVDEPPRPAIPRHAVYFGLFTQDMAELAASPWYDAQTPRVSIIILNWNRSEMTAACVRYVLRHTQCHRYEVIIVDNGSSPTEIATLHQSGVPARIIELGSNRYFGEANNIAAEQARGEYLVFLNNDAFVHEGWLEPLVDTIERLPNVGAVGSRLIYPDGSLQEAGALVSWDGIANQLGKFSPIDEERYSSLRQVDYVSAAALLMRRQDFLDVLGFDLCWEPAYFEDVDLCLKLRASGKPIYYCPNSIVTHVENATSLDKGHSLKLENVIQVNRMTFVSRWGNYLLGGPAKLPIPLPYHPPLPGSGRPRVALYTPFFLTPGGGERYLLSIAQALADQADVTLVTGARCSAIRLQRIGLNLQLDISNVALATLDEALAGPTFDLAFIIGNAVLPPLPGLGQHNVYICQFPFPMRDSDAKEWRPNWEKFDKVIVYSDYARRFFDQRRAMLGLSKDLPVQIVTPPVHLLRPAPVKKRMILSVGRFFAGHHCKRQDLMVEAFRQLVADGADYELHLAGSLRPEPEHRQYYLSIVNAAKGLPVFIHPNTELAELEQLYADSTLYWHLTGMETDTAAEPERSEHFGIAIVEAMSAGCIPIAFNNGGPTEIIQPGENGYLVNDLPQLVAQSRTLLADPVLLERLARQAMASSVQYDEAAFALAVRALASGLLPQPVL
jgi:GT2 family glycosyltransferase/glycosyltransferase involved in cell wall biosynthesis